MSSSQPSAEDQMASMRQRDDVGGVLYGYFQQSKFSDCKIRCGTRIFHCHKIILCSRSQFFAAALDGTFAESIESIVDLSAELPDDIACMLYFIYSGDYVPIAKLEEGESHCKCGTSHKKDVDDLGLMEHLNAHVNMYAIGDRLSVFGLKNKAVHHFTSLLRNHDEDSTHKEVLKSGVAERVYATTPFVDRGLRTPLCDFLGDSLADIQKIISDPELKRIMEGIEGLSTDLLETIIREVWFP